METEKNRKDYANSKIYKIEPVCEHDESDVYYGSTTQPLSKRMGYHRRGYKGYKEGKCGKLTVFDLFDKYGLDNCKIFLVEDCPCDRKEQLEKREGEIIKSNKCVNKIVVGRTRSEHYQDNKEIINQKRSQKFTCECGSIVCLSVKARHLKSQRHLAYEG